MSGQSVIGGEITSKIPSFIDNSRKPDLSGYGINAREMEVIGLVANGLNNKEIADALYLSEGTVRNYFSVVLEKLGLRDLTQLAVFYYKHER